MHKQSMNIDHLCNIHFDSSTLFDAPNITHMNYWYSQEAIRKLSIIKHIVSQIKNKDIKEFYLVIF